MVNHLNMTFHWLHHSDCVLLHSYSHCTHTRCYTGSIKNSSSISPIKVILNNIDLYHLSLEAWINLTVTCKIWKWDGKSKTARSIYVDMGKIDTEALILTLLELNLKLSCISTFANKFVYRFNVFRLMC